MPKVESYLPAENGINLFTVVWSPPEGTPIKGKVIYVHGFAEHCGHYGHDEMFEPIAAKGFEVVMFDQRGSGRSATDKQAGVSNDYYVYKDLDLVLNRFVIGPKYEGMVAFWGYSMGGAIILNYGIKGLYRHRIDSYLAGSPLVEVAKDTQASRFLLMMQNVLAALVPNWNFIRTRLSADKLSHDQEFVKLVNSGEDRLFRNIMAPEFGRDFLSRGKKLLEQGYLDSFVDRPLLMILAGDDKVADAESAKKVFEMLPIKGKRLVIVEGGYHNLINETPQYKDQYTGHLLGWFEEQYERWSSSKCK